MDIGPYELIVLAAWLIPIAIVIRIADRKQLNVVGFAIAAILAWPIALIVAVMSRDRRR